jgi:hypothetical protein
MHYHTEYVDICRIHIKTPWVIKLFYNKSLAIKGLYFGQRCGRFNKYKHLIPELYEPGFGVKKFGYSGDFHSFLGCFWNNLQIHIKAEYEIFYFLIILE